MAETSRTNENGSDPDSLDVEDLFATDETDLSIDDEESRAGPSGSGVAAERPEDTTADELFDVLRNEHDEPGGEVSDDIAGETPEDLMARADETASHVDQIDAAIRPDEDALGDLLLTGRREANGFLWVDTDDASTDEASNHEARTDESGTDEASNDQDATDPAPTADGPTSGASTDDSTGRSGDLGSLFALEETEDADVEGASRDPWVTDGPGGTTDAAPSTGAPESGPSEDPGRDAGESTEPDEDGVDESENTESDEDDGLGNATESGSDGPSPEGGEQASFETRAATFDGQDGATEAGGRGSAETESTADEAVLVEKDSRAGDVESEDRDADDAGAEGGVEPADEDPQEESLADRIRSILSG